MIWVLVGGLVVAGLLWAVRPVLSAPRARRYVTVVPGVAEGFSFWPPCPVCGNYAVTCVARTPAHRFPAGAYTLVCDHGVDPCGTTFTMSCEDILEMQDMIRRDRQR